MKGQLTAALLLSVGLATSAQADLFVATGNNPQTDFNVQFTNGQTAAGNVGIIGNLQNTGGTVRFTSTESLSTQGSGQARIFATDNNLGNLTIDAGAGFTGFSTLILNIDAGANTQIRFNTSDNFGQPGFVNSNGIFNLDANGQNFFTFTSQNGQFFDFLSFTTLTGSVIDVAQVRVGGLTNAAIVPGPIAGAGLPALLALGGFVWARRRKAAATA